MEYTDTLTELVHWVWTLLYIGTIDMTNPEKLHIDIEVEHRYLVKIQ